MSNTQTDHLFKLIKTLSKSEKRNFRLYVNRVQKADDVKFVQLFDVLDRQKVYDELEIIKKVVGIKKSQLSNLKRHLYKQLLISLRLIHIQKDISIQIREQVDFAKILYGKGLYLQSLKILDKVKIIAKDAHQDLLHLEIIEFEKLIENRHITRSIDNRAEQLAEESDRRNEVINLSGKLSNLALRLYGMYIKIGHIKNEKDSFIIKEFFKTNLPKTDINKLTFFEKVYLYQCHVWYYFILQNFLNNYKYAQKWVDLFNSYPEMKQIDPGLYMRGTHNLLIALFYLNHFEKFTKTLEDLEQFDTEYGGKFDTNTQVTAFLYISTSRFNKHFMEGSFTEGLKMIPYVEKQLVKLKPHLDQHRILVFYYKIACMYFSSGDNGTAIDYLNRIINLKVGNLREDIQCYARLLHLIAHYELGHYNLLEYLVKSVYRFLGKMEDLNQIQREILRFLKKALYMDPKSLKEAFIQLKSSLEKSFEDDYEKRSFLYLDFISWLESKIENRPVQDVIHEKFLKKSQKKSSNNI